MTTYAAVVAVVRIPNTLRSLTGGAGEVTVAGPDLGRVLDELERLHPGVAERVIGEHGRLYGFVNVFVDGDECRTLDGLATAVDDDTMVAIVPAVAGG